MKDCTVHRCRLAMFVCCPIYCAFSRIVYMCSGGEAARTLFQHAGRGLVNA